jgi:hypothetical protein
MGMHPHDKGRLSTGMGPQYFVTLKMTIYMVITNHKLHVHNIDFGGLGNITPHFFVRA